MRSAEIKQAVVEHHVGPGIGILNPDGGMTVKFIYCLAGLTCQQICVYTVILSLGSLKQEDECGQKYNQFLVHVGFVIFCKVNVCRQKKNKTCLLFSIFAVGMRLLLDFGNTRVKAAVSGEGGLRGIYCGPADAELLSEAVREIETDGGMWCSVHQLDTALQQWMTGLGLSALTPATPVPLRNGYSSPSTLGMDRLAAAVGAWSIKPGHDLLVIDAGTAVTCDFVSADGEYKGGNIAPGIGLRLKSETAVRSGVINGLRYELAGFISDLEVKYPSLLVFLTGGDAEIFDIKAKSSIFAVPDLVLRGLARIVEFNEKDF